MNLTHRQNRLGILAVVAVALLAGDRLVFTPLAKLWKERSVRITELRKSVAQGTLLLDRQRSILARWDNMRTNALLQEASLAEDQVLSAFDRWSQASRIGVTSVRPQWKRAAEDYATLECRVDASGSLPSIARFLYDLERDPLGLRVEVVEITSRDTRGEQLTLGLQVSGLLLNLLELP